MLVIAVIIIAIISILWAFWSLRSLQKHAKISEEVKDELATGRVVFQEDRKLLSQPSEVSKDSSSEGLA